MKLQDMGVAISLVAAFIAIGAALVTMSGHTDRITAAVTSAMLQAMQRGYQCHVDGRSLEDCQDEQRKKWEDAKR